MINNKVYIWRKRYVDWDIFVYVCNGKDNNYFEYYKLFLYIFVKVDVI